VSVPPATAFFDPLTETLDRQSLLDLQLARIQALLEEVLPSNAFYARKLGPRCRVTAWDAFVELPFTTKRELAQDQAENPPYGTDLTYPLERYIKLHQTSGTTGKTPIRWLDTEASWDWWAHCWGHVYAGAGVGPRDRVFFAFSFGPFIGFWAAYEGARKVGAMSIPGGGLQTDQRLQSMIDNQVTAVCCTPTYALRLADEAARLGIDLRASPIRATVHAGEPGASIPAVRARIEQAFGARCFDHTGMTELGATGFTCQLQNGVHLIESEFVFEVIDPQTLQPVPHGAQGELVATNLGRSGMPLIRYRTGDLVQLDASPCACGRTSARLVGGILGRADDMLVVRGVNVFPSAIEGVVRQFECVDEFRIEVRREREMLNVRVVVEIDDDRHDAEQIAATLADLQGRLRSACGIRIDADAAAGGTLPRWELKARRVIRIE
jgi:phenylacetate-CoA ligase